MKNRDDASAAMPAPRVCWVGDWTLPDFAPTRAQLFERGVPGEGGHFEGLTNLWGDAEASPPDLVLVAQSWPDQFAAGDVADLFARWPLARIVCVYGPWCEADGRTRSTWPPAQRVPAWAAVPRILRELGVLTSTGQATEMGRLASSLDQHGRPAGPADLLPGTASLTEIFLHRASAPRLSASGAGTICPRALVVSSDRAWREMMVACLRAAGIGAVEGTSLAPGQVSVGHGSEAPGGDDPVQESIPPVTLSEALADASGWCGVPEVRIGIRQAVSEEALADASGWCEERAGATRPWVLWDVSSLELGWATLRKHITAGAFVVGFVDLADASACEQLRQRGIELAFCKVSLPSDWLEQACRAAQQRTIGDSPAGKLGSA